MFVLKKNGETFYSRAGAFIFDANGQLVNPQNGAIVQGKVATDDGTIPPGNNLENINIDSNLRLPAIATTDISWGGNLDSTSPVTRSENYVQSGNIDADMLVGDTVEESNTVYDELGNSYNFKTTYEKTAANTYNITYELLDMDGNPTSPAIGPTTVEAVFDGDPTDGKMLSLNGNNPPEAINIQNISLGIDFDFDPTDVVQRTTETLSSSVDNNRASTIVSGTV